MSKECICMDNELTAIKNMIAGAFSDVPYPAIKSLI